MAYQNSIPFYEKYWYKHNYKRVTDSLLLILLLSLLGYRVISINNYSLFPWFVAFLCESWFTFSWFLTLTTQWSPAVTKTYPHRLLQRYLIIVWIKCLVVINLVIINCCYYFRKQKKNVAITITENFSYTNHLLSNMFLVPS